MRVLVVGGTGMLGRLICASLVRRGVETRAFARSAAEATGAFVFVGDLSDGRGLGAALDGVDAVIHASHDYGAAANDARDIANLLAACGPAGVRHVVYTGIVGIDTATATAYYAGKQREEQRIAASGLPFTLYRAAQFHTLVDETLTRLDGGGDLRVPADVVLRPVDPAVVADRLAEAAMGAPANGRVCLVGPQTLSLPQLARIWLNDRGDDRAVVETPVDDGMLRGFAALEREPAEAAGPTFSQFLAQRAA